MKKKLIIGISFLIFLYLFITISLRIDYSIQSKTDGFVGNKKSTIILDQQNKLYSFSGDLLYKKILTAYDEAEGLENYIQGDPNFKPLTFDKNSNIYVFHSEGQPLLFNIPITNKTKKIKLKIKTKTGFFLSNYPIGFGIGDFVTEWVISNRDSIIGSAGPQDYKGGEFTVNLNLENLKLNYNLAKGFYLIPIVGNREFITVVLHMKKLPENDLEIEWSSIE